MSPTNGTLDEDACGFGDYTHNNTIRELTLCATSRGKPSLGSRLDVNGIYCRYLCPKEPDEEGLEKEDFVRYWSDVTNWPEGRLP